MGKKVKILIVVTLGLIIGLGLILYLIFNGRIGILALNSEYEILENSDKFKSYYVDVIHDYTEYSNYKLEKEYTNDKLKEKDFKKNNYVIVKLFRTPECYSSLKYKKVNIDSQNNMKIYLSGKEVCLNYCKEGTYFIEIPVSKTINEINLTDVYIKSLTHVICPELMVYKPIIYIYPKEDMDLNIKLLNNDLLTHTYPKYTNEWNVKVSKNGNIYDYKTKRNYYALYWEGIDNTPSNMNEGFVVEGKDTIKFLEEKLEYLGLNEREINEFIIYWIDKLENNKYNFIRFRTTEEVNEYMPLKINVKPDTLIRIIMNFKPLENKIEVIEQHLSKVTREGYTIVEWGGRKIK